MHVVIFAGGTTRPGKAMKAALANTELVIAADNGASTALEYGIIPNLVVGDFDSLTIPLQHLAERGSALVRANVEKDETDTELAIQTAVARGADEITLLGASGGMRLDHTIANILLLASCETVPLRIVDGPSICWLLRGPGQDTIQGQPEDLLSLFPLTADATGVTTSGLYYPLSKDTLYFGKPRGISNKFTQNEAVVSLEQGMLLIVHSDVQELHSTNIP